MRLKTCYYHPTKLFYNFHIHHCLHQANNKQKIKTLKFVNTKFSSGEIQAHHFQHKLKIFKTTFVESFLIFVKNFAFFAQKVKRLGLTLRIGKA